MKMITTNFIKMSGWGDLMLFPHIDISINYSIPTIMVGWWVFRFDIKIWHRMSDKTMKIWDFITFNRSKEEE